jgi:UDP-glucose:(heptosyl)LPS alpha-1,3-glucosyltransferase
MPGLDIYYAADPCFVEKAITQRGFYYQYTPRYYHFKDFEEQVFGASCATKILTLSELQRQVYLKHYPDCADRMLNLPPGISPDRQVIERNPEWRVQLRHDFNINEKQLLLLQVGSGFRVKGVDRSLKAIAALPPRLKRRVRFLVIGQDRATRFRWQAQRLGLERQVSFLSGRDDIPHFFAGADLLLHPAYEESAGYVLLEAAIAGLPVLTTATCGYADYVKKADAGEICAQPFSQNDLNSRLTAMLEKLDSAPWSANGLRYGRRPELYTMPQKAVDYIEQITSTGESSV